MWAIAVALSIASVCSYVEMIMRSQNDGIDRKSKSCSDTANAGLVLHARLRKKRSRPSQEAIQKRPRHQTHEQVSQPWSLGMN